MTHIISNFLSSLGDLDLARTLITPEAEFIAARAEAYEALPLYGTYVGPEGLAQFVQELRRVFETKSFQIDHVIETETIGSAFGRFEHLVPSTGRFFRSHWAVMCRFDAGLIASYRFYEDTAALEEAMAVSTKCREGIA